MSVDTGLGAPLGTRYTNASQSTRPYGSPSHGSAEYSSIEFPRIEFRGAILDVGIFRDTLLPSLGLNTGLSLISYGIARSTNRVEIKDWAWPLAPVLNVWWSAVGRRVMLNDENPIRVVSRMSRPEKLLLGGVTLWGTRLLYRVVSRSLARQNQGKSDDDRYVKAKNEDGFWNAALWKLFLSEAVVQTVTSLAFVAPFRHQGGVFTGYHPIVQAFSVGMFFTGFALEVLGDSQLEQFKKDNSGADVCQEGVWSIVRHPNYLGDALIHFSFPLLLFSSDMLAPVEILGPIANYLFIRHVGMKQTEQSQIERYVDEKEVKLDQYHSDPKVNPFWPRWEQLQNSWTWVVLGAGAAGAVVEQLIHLSGLD